jgi:hypothetical protein
MLCYDAEFPRQPCRDRAAEQDEQPPKAKPASRRTARLVGRKVLSISTLSLLRLAREAASPESA